MSAGKNHQFYNLVEHFTNKVTLPSNNGIIYVSHIGTRLFILGLILATAGCIAHDGNVPTAQDAALTNTTSIIQENICYEINQSVNTTEKYPVGYPDQFKKYWVHIDPIADHKAGDVFQITGCTNVPAEVTFWGGVTQSEYFTPLGSSFVPSTTKNINVTPGHNDSIHYLSYDVNSTEFEYSFYRFDVLPTDPYNKSTSVSDWRIFNITH